MNHRQSTPESPTYLDAALAAAERAGLEPERTRRGWTPIRCPNGCDEHKRRRACGVSEAGGWHCFRCGGGGRVFDLAEGGRELAAAMPRREREREPQAPRFDLAAAWCEARGGDPAPIVRFLVDVRGWPEILARAAAELPDVAHVAPEHFVYGDDSPGAGLAPLRRRCHLRAGAWPLLIGLRDPAGRLRSAVRRWTGGGPTPLDRDGERMGKGRRLSNTDTGAGGEVLLFGHLPDELAQARESGRLYLAEGELDFLLLRALRAAGRLAGAVLGVPGASEARKVAEALREALEPGDSFRVVSLGDADPSGTKMGQAVAEVLRGRLRVERLRWPAEAPEGYDVGDLVRERGPDELLRALAEDLDELAAAPVRMSLAEADAGGLARELERASTWAAEDPARLALFSASIGSGKTQHALAAAAAAAQAGCVVIVAEPSHERIGHEIKRLRELAPKVKAVHVEGRGEKTCHIWERIEPWVKAGMGRKATCAGCEFQRGCPGARSARIEAGKVSFLAHAMLQHLEDLPADAVLLADEDCAGLDVRELRGEDLAAWTASPTYPALRDYLNESPHLVQAARCLADVLADEAARWASVKAEARESGRRRWPELLLGSKAGELLALKARKVLGDANAGDVLEAVAAAELEDLPRPDGAMVRDGFAAPSTWPTATGLEVLRAVARLALNHMGREIEAPAWTVHLSEMGDRVGLRRLPRLPEGLPAVILDGTSALTEASYRAAFPGRVVRVFGVEVLAPVPAKARWIESGSFSRWKLLDGAGKVRAEALPRLRRVIRLGLAEAVERGGDLGLIAARPVLVELAEGGRLVDLAAEAVQAGHAIRVQHFGAGRGSNDLDRGRGVAVLLHLGDDCPNLGALHADADALGLERDRYADAVIEARAVQNLGRARALRRKDIALLYVGRTAPAGWSWEREELEAGRPAGEAAEVLARAAWWAWEVLGVSGPAVLRALAETGPCSQKSLPGKAGCQTPYTGSPIGEMASGLGAQGLLSASPVSAVDLAEALEAVDRGRQGEVCRLALDGLPGAWFDVKLRARAAVYAVDEAAAEAWAAAQRRPVVKLVDSAPPGIDPWVWANWDELADAAWNGTAFVALAAPATYGGAQAAQLPKLFTRPLEPRTVEPPLFLDLGEGDP